MSNGIQPTNNFDFASIGLGVPEEDKTIDNDLGKDAFMTLLVAQINNPADPLNPESDTDFVAQTAQFNSLDALQSLKGTMEDFVAQSKADKALQASSLVGKSVLVPGDLAVLDNGNLTTDIELSASVANLNIAIQTPKGDLVENINLGIQPAGTTTFQWDGSLSTGGYAPAGIYKIVAQAVINDETLQLPTSVLAKVDGVVIDDEQGLILNTDNLGNVQLSKVKEIQE